MKQEMIDRATLRTKGYWYEDFETGRVFEHHWGRTLSQAESAIFTSLTLHFNPLYTNAEYARALGHADTPLNPYLVFNTVFGLSVQDLSENGVAFLGVDELKFHEPVMPGDTITARSTVVQRRPSQSNPKTGIATWHTEGFNQHGKRVCDFLRSNLILRRDLVSEQTAQC
ncbi:MaoC family dehydratase [Cupriavidus basilensis]|uniref:MaoC family dehydratase n=1 Tax=Cupriavidus basilensis TaxID=68895 RepID=UPI0005BCDCBB|nr:MaoC family dehydratase [Cupriavidus basilensis]